MYYETQCPFAKRFISSFEFRDTIYSMGSYMDIKLYPYGSAEVGTKKQSSLSGGPYNARMKSLEPRGIKIFLSDSISLA